MRRPLEKRARKYAARRPEMHKPTVHDRRSSDLPINSVVSIAIVSDPYAAGEKIEVLRSVRDDPLAGMHARGHIDDAQLAAGRLWQKHYENSEIGGIRAIDPGKEAVDGGRMPEAITDKQAKAFRALSAARQYLGAELYGLVNDILGRRVSTRLAAEARGRWTRAGWIETAHEFRHALEMLAVLWGLAMTRLHRGPNQL